MKIKITTMFDFYPFVVRFRESTITLAVRYCFNSVFVHREGLSVILGKVIHTKHPGSGFEDYLCQSECLELMTYFDLDKRQLLSWLYNITMKDNKISFPTERAVHSFQSFNYITGEYETTTYTPPFVNNLENTTKDIIEVEINLPPLKERKGLGTSRMNKKAIEIKPVVLPINI